LSNQKKKNLGFTLIEMIISITLFSGILLVAFSAFGNIAHLKNKIVSDVDVYEQLYVAVESLTSLIKDSGDIDYEEYFNRSLVGTTLSG
jgi:prepilin-type N-terminal cleavage/methylation domain-containing protein